MEVYANLALGHLPAFGENFNNSLISNPSSLLKAKVIKTLVGGIGETLRCKLLPKDQHLAISVVKKLQACRKWPRGQR